MLLPIVTFIVFVAAVNLVLFMGRRKRRAELERRLDMDTAAAPDPDAADLSDRDRTSIFATLDRSLRNLSVSELVRRELRRANWALKVSEFLVFVLMSASLPPLLVLLITDNRTLAGLLIAAGGAAPVLYLRRRQAARRKLIGSQILDALNIISSALKSGYSFIQALDTAGRELPEPIAGEFRKVIQEIKLGIDFEKALNNMVDRVNNEDLDLVVTCVNIQREVGGNLSEILDKIAHTVRERIRIKGQIRTLTAQGRISGWVLALLPLILALFIYLIYPAYIEMMWTHPVGRGVLFLCIFLEMLGVVSIRRIVNIKV